MTLIILQFQLACQCILSCLSDIDGFAENLALSHEPLVCQQQFLYIICII